MKAKAPRQPTAHHRFGIEPAFRRQVGPPGRLTRRPRYGLPQPPQSIAVYDPRRPPASWPPADRAMMVPPGTVTAPRRSRQNGRQTDAQGGHYDQIGLEPTNGREGHSPCGSPSGPQSGPTNVALNGLGYSGLPLVPLLLSECACGHHGRCEQPLLGDRQGTAERLAASRL